MFNSFVMKRINAFGCCVGFGCVSGGGVFHVGGCVWGGERVVDALQLSKSLKNFVFTRLFWGLFGVM